MLRNSKKIAVDMTRRFKSKRPTSIIRFLDENHIARYGQCDEDQPKIGSIAHALEGNIFSPDVCVTDVKFTIHGLLAPIFPSVIIDVGLNYKAHIAETKLPSPENPAIFQTNPCSVQSHLAPIILPEVCSKKGEVDYEGELAVILGTACKDATVENAMDYVLGYTCSNDISARKWQNAKRQSGQWYKSKSFDTFTPLGPRIVLKSEIENPHNLKIKTILNGKIMQDSNSSDMLKSISEIIAFCSQDCLLPPGTVICTGSPPGVGYTRNPRVYLKDGDEVSVEIERIGRLTNTVCEKKKTPKCINVSEIEKCYNCDNLN